MPQLAPVIGLIGVFLTLLVAGLYIAAAAWLAWWMLEPINKVAGVLRATTQYLLTDFLGLMLLLQFALATLGRAIDTGRDRDGSPYWLLMFLAALLVLVLWGASVSVVSRAGIVRPLRRLAVIVLLVPGTLAVIVSLPAAAIGLFIGLARLTDSEFLLSVAVLGCLGLLIAVPGLRWLSYWALAGTTGEMLLVQMTKANPKRN